MRTKKNIIWKEGKWSVEETFPNEPQYGRHYLYHEDLPGWVAEVVEYNVWKKKYNSDPKTFKEVAVARRVKALKDWWQKLSLQQDTIENEIDILQGK